MKLPAIGRVENVDDLDLDPIEVPVIAYMLNKEEVEQTFRFRPVQPAGAALDILKATGADGGVPVGVVMRFLDECVLAEDREAWELFLHRADLVIDQAILVRIYQAVSEVYSDRPTPRWSDSDGGGSASATTSLAAVPSAASASKKRTSPKR